MSASRFASLIGPVALHYWGPPNRAQSRPGFPRWGNKGSRSVNLHKGAWYDHERIIGGGVVDLIKLEEGDSVDLAAALERFGLPKGEEQPRRVEIDYPYVDEHGEIIYFARRIEIWTPGKPEADKTMRQHRGPDANGRLQWGMAGVTALPYNLPELLKHPTKTVFIAEGEKCVEAIRSLGFLATTNHGGAGKWWPSLDPWFANRRCIIVPDHDEAGTRHMHTVAEHLQSVGASVRVLDYPDKGPKWDIYDWVNEGGTREAFEAMAKAAKPYATIEPATDFDTPPEPAEAKPNRITLIPWADLPDLEVRWLVNELIPAQGFAALYGKPGTYKSFVALYIAAMIANGQPAFERATEPGDVVYIAGEGGAGLKLRRDALMKQHGLPDTTRVHFIRAQLNLRSTDEDTEHLIAAVQDAGLKPALVIVDTLARAFAGGNENSSEDMGAFIRHCGRVQEELQTALMIVHHSGKDEARGQRGHSSLLGAVDTELEVVKLTSDDAPEDAPKQGKMTVTKQKDGEDGFALTYRMATVPLTPTGSKSSLAVVPKNIDATTQRPRKSLNRNARSVLAALQMALDEGNGKAVGLAQIPQGAVCVEVNTWRTYWYAACPQEKETARRYFSRALNDLVDSGTIGAWSDYAWMSNA